LARLVGRLRRGELLLIAGVAVLAVVLVPSGAARTSSSLTLVWTVEPASAVHDRLITGTPYVDNKSGLYVSVAAENGGGIQRNASGTVTLTPSSGAFTQTGLTASFTNGVAQFTGLMGSTIGNGFTLQATSPGYANATSTPFNISLTGEACKGNCPKFSTLLDHGVQVQSSATGTFTFLALSPYGIPGNVTLDGGGCAGYVPVANAAFQETDGRTGTSNALNFIFGIPQAAIKSDPNIGNGNPFIPICAGSAHVDAQGTVIPCTATGALAYGPWIGEALDQTTHNFAGFSQPAVCDQATGLYWGILGSYQDPTIDPATSPIVTNWKSDNTYRFFYVNVPSYWDWSMG